MFISIIPLYQLNIAQNLTIKMRFLYILVIFTINYSIYKSLKLVYEHGVSREKILHTIWFKDVSTNDTCQYELLLMDHYSNGMSTLECKNESLKLPCDGKCPTGKAILPHDKLMTSFYVKVKLNGKLLVFSIKNDISQLEFLPFIKHNNLSTLIYYPLVIKGHHMKRISLHSHGSVILTDYYINTAKNIHAVTSAFIIPLKNMIDDNPYKFKFSHHYPSFYYYPNNMYHTSDYTGRVASILNQINPNTFSLSNLYSDKSVMCQYEFLFPKINSNSDNFEYHLKNACNGVMCMNLCDNISKLSLPDFLQNNTFTISITSNDHMITHTRTYLKNEEIFNDISVNYLGDYIINLQKFSDTIDHVNSTIHPVYYRAESSQYISQGDGLGRILLYGFKLATRYRLFSTLNNANHRYESEFTSEGIDHGYNIVSGIDVVNVSPETIRALSDRIKLQLERARNKVVCRLYVSTHPRLNFIPAKCNQRGDYCIKSCFSTFEVHKLKQYKSYYFKVVAAEVFSDFLSMEPIRYPNQINFNIVRVDVSESYFMMLFKVIPNLNNMVGLRCMIFISEPIAFHMGNYVYKICGQDTFCVLPCRNIIMRTKHIQNRPNLIFSIKIIHYIDHYLDFSLNKMKIYKTNATINVSKLSATIKFNKKEYISIGNNFERYRRSIETTKGKKYFNFSINSKKIDDDEENLDVQHPIIRKSMTTMDHVLWDIKMEGDENSIHPLGAEHFNDTIKINTNSNSSDSHGSTNCTNEKCNKGHISKHIINIYNKFLSYTAVYDRVLINYYHDYPTDYKLPDLENDYEDDYDILNESPSSNKKKSKNHFKKLYTAGLIVSVLVLLVALIVPIIIYFIRTSRKVYCRFIPIRRGSSQINLISKTLLSVS